MKRAALFSWWLASCIACDNTSPSSTPTSSSSNETTEKIAVAVKGSAYEIEKLLVPGQVTIVDFGAKW
jgi:hypothetical protein